MTLETTPYNAAEHLVANDAIAAYLDAALSTSDPAFIADAIGLIARARGMSQIATDSGLARDQGARFQVHSYREIG